MKRLKGKNKLHPRSFVKTVLADTEDFWAAMCKTGFVRVSSHEGWCGKTRYVTAIPPEYVEGFIEGKIEEVADDLAPNRSKTATFLKLLARLF